MRRSRALLAVLAAAVAPAMAAEPSRPAVSVTLEPAGGAAYHKKPLLVEVEFRNRGEQPLTLDASAFGPEAFEIADEKGRPAARGDDGKAPPAEGLRVDGYETSRKTVDLSAWYPKIASRKNRTWTIRWTHGGMASAPAQVRIIKPYDPRKDRTAIVRTSLGSMTWTFLPEHAPRHVKRFVDLARQGHYDGLTIFRVVPGLQAEGGDPKGDGTGAWEKLQPPELAGPELAMGPGLVGASRQETSMTSDTMFFITMGPVDFMKGLQTFYARVTDGLEVVALLHRRESRGATGLSDAFLLIEPVTIQAIEVR